MVAPRHKRSKPYTYIVSFFLQNELFAVLFIFILCYQYQKFGVQPVPEIDHMLEVVSQTFHLPLTQYWMFEESESQLLLVQKFSYEVPEINWC